MTTRKLPLFFSSVATSKALASQPEKKTSAKRKTKTLGDKSYLPSTQTMCMMTGHELAGDAEVLVRLAQSYKFEGDDRTSICAHNADVNLTYNRSNLC